MLLKIINGFHRAQAFRVVGGIEEVLPGETKTLDVQDELSPQRLDMFRVRGVMISPMEPEAEQPESNRDTPLDTTQHIRNARTGSPASDPAQEQPAPADRAERVKALINGLDPKKDFNADGSPDVHAINALLDDGEAKVTADERNAVWATLKPQE